MDVVVVLVVVVGGSMKAHDPVKFARWKKKSLRPKTTGTLVLLLVSLSRTVNDKQTTRDLLYRRESVVNKLTNGNARPLFV